MKIRKILLFILIPLFSAPLTAQDIHFSLFEWSPLTLNPANTGAFEGTVRIGGIYRDQWRSVIDQPFSTPAIYADAPIIKGLGDMDWIGIGFTAFNDQAGSAAYGHTGGFLSAAYHLALDKNRGSVLTLGLQGGLAQRRIRIDNEDVRFPDEVEENLLGNTTFVSEDRGNVRENSDYFDLNVGLLFKSRLNERMDIILGVAGGHINSPRYGLLGSGGGMTPMPPQGQGQNRIGERLDPRIAAHGRFNIQMSEKFTFSPAFFYQTLGPADEINVQGWGGLLLNPEKQITLNVGLGYRFRDAVQVLLGADIKDLSIALSYDVNISDLSEVSNTVGGFELAAAYIIKIYKEPELKPVIFCPRF